MLMTVVGFSDSTTVVLTPQIKDTTNTNLIPKEPYKKEDNKTLQAVIIMLFVGFAMGFSGEINPK